MVIAIARRGLDILLLAVCGCLVGWAILSLRIPLPGWIGKNAEMLTTGWLGFLLMTAFWAVVLSGGGLGTAFSYRQIAKVRYPSVFWAVVLGYWLMLFLPGAVHAVFGLGIPGSLRFSFGRPLNPLDTLITPLTCLLGGMMLKDIFCLCLKKKHDGVESAAPGYDPDLPDDLQWILDERPAKKLNDCDKFHQGPLVRRLAKILRTADGKCLPKTIGMVGPYGSGKSTIVNFIETELHHPQEEKGKNIHATRKDIVFVRVPGWGIADHGLTGFVLQCVVEKLEGLGIDCLAIRGLPAEYMAAIGVVNDKAGKIAGAFCSPVRNPQEVLNRLAPVLDATGLILVLCIEDAERGASKDTLQELAALLDRFRHMQRITFIVEANQNSNEHLDLARICDHVEIVPSMSNRLSWRYLCELRKSSVKYALDRGDFLLAEKILTSQEIPSYRVEDQFWSEDEMGGVVYQVGLHRHPEYAFRIQFSRTLATPRVFKHALRAIWTAWKHLHGEVDLRELMLLNILREVSPEAWDFVLHNIDGLRGVSYGEMGNAEKLKARRAEYLAEWQDVMRGKENSNGILAILKALDMNFDDNNPSMYRREANVQTLHLQPQPVDYFRRILAGEVDDGEIRDQFVLRQIKAWRECQADSVPRLMLDKNGFAEKVEQFKDFLGGGAAECRLCDEFLRLVLNRYGPKADDDCPGFGVVKKLVRMRIGEKAWETSWEKWLTEHIDRAFDVSLRMVHTLYMFPGDQVIDRSVLRQHIAESLIKHVEEDPGYLGRVLDPDHPYTLYHHLRFRSDFPAFNTPEDWEASFLSFLRSGEKNPAQVVPHLAQLLIRDARQMGYSVAKGSSNYAFEIDYAGRLMPAKEARECYVNLLTSYAAREEATQEVAERILAVESDLRAFAKMEIGVPGEASEAVGAGEVDDSDSDAIAPALTPKPLPQNDSAVNDSVNSHCEEP